MGSFLSKIKTTKLKLFIMTGALAVLGFVAFSFLSVQAAPGLDPILADLEPGDISGFAWMGTDINNPGHSDGGGGWLNMSCKTSYCYDLNGNGNLDDSEKWGVKMNIDHSGVDGAFEGYAWSSNYGWLSFSGGGISRCWTAHPGVTTDGMVRADMSGGTGLVDVTGWAKFVAGDDIDTDGWDGCVAFSGSNHSVQLDMDTGDLIGWAWGGPVVGWISFQNPECPECNTSVALSGTPQMTFWVNPSVLLPGMTSANIKWTSNTANGNYIEACTEYANTSGYNHWDSDLPNVSPNVVEISRAAGNLPAGLHPANGINQTTTYSIDCKDRYGQQLPTKYATVIVQVPGCTDPSAPNYNPLANIDDGSCGGAGAPSLTLNVITNGTPNNTLPEGSSNSVDYQVSPRWVFTNRNQFAPSYCTQSFKDENGVTQNLNAWTGAQLSIPPNVGNNPFDTTGNSWVTTTNIATYADDAPVGSIFTFTISCTDLIGNVISASDTVIIVEDPDDPPTPSLALFAENPTLIIGSGNYDEKLWWSSNNPSELSSCEGDFVRISPSAQNPNLTGWETANLPEPNVNQNPGYTSHQNAFNTLAGNVTVPATYRFTLTCDDDLHPGETVDATANVQFIIEPVSTEPPFVSLIIKTPDTNPVGGGSEQIPAAGIDPFTLKWQALNVHGCKAKSDQYLPGGTAPVSSNANWDGQSVPDDGDPTDSSMVEKTFPILPPDNMNTIFFIEDCVPDDATTFGTAPLPDVWVCMSITGQAFPSCTPSGPGRPPAYIEI